MGIIKQVLQITATLGLLAGVAGTLTLVSLGNAADHILPKANDHIVITGDKVCNQRTGDCVPL
jgi:hypothetical protein